MLERILFVVCATSEGLHAAPFVARLALCADSQIIALNVVDAAVARRVVTATGLTTPELFVKMEQEGWRYLYEVEDCAKGLGAKIVLLQDEGFPDAAIVSVAKRFKVDLVALPRSRTEGYAQSRGERVVEALMDRLDCPVMVV